MLQLFALTLFLSAGLLFSVQPMIAKIVLPLVGGSPAVWGTCMVFFQAALLAGYAYAHATTTWLGVRRQMIVHVGLLLLILFVLPLGISPKASSSLSPEDNPSGWLLTLLLTSVGLPFFAVSTSAPLLQRWFANTGHPAARDPYFLYGASNFGSLLALLAYVVLIEPNLRLAQQCMTWTVGYVLLVALTLGCAAFVWRSQAPAVPSPANIASAVEPDHFRVGQVLYWIYLAFVPSSLMLGVTMYLTTDIAAIPLLWVIPLALYLLTFILTFARRPALSHSWMIRAFPMVAVVLALCMSVSSVMQPVFIPIHLMAFFLTAMLCHGEMVKRRPPRRQLTAFYLAMSCGGVLGGLFNALVAPRVFDRVVEYPLALILACLVLPGTPSGLSTMWQRRLDWALPMMLGIFVWGFVTILRSRAASHEAVVVLVVVSLAALVCYAFKGRSVRFALGLCAVFLAVEIYTRSAGRVLYQHRDYFGVLQVVQVAAGNYHRLIHGQTVHGQQSLDSGRRREPLTYYHRTGPIGQVFEVFHSRPARSKVAVVGLGAGTLACYAEPGERWTFYEIDPAVERIARNPNYFTFLEECPADSTEVILGDARLRLGKAPEHGYGLIVLDAFSSDAIPTHLLTREALQLYCSKLAQGGILAFHISNRYVDLVPVLGALALDGKLKCLVRSDSKLSPEAARSGKEPSTWVTMAPCDANMGALVEDPRWESPLLRAREAVWTDDYSNTFNHFLIR